MCDVTARSRRARTTPHPRWDLLYGLAVVEVGALLGIETVVSSSVPRIVLRGGLALAAFVAMAVWVRLNRVALDGQDWCDCAASTISMRVIPSRRPEPQLPPVEDGRVEEQEEVVAPSFARR